MIRDTKHNDESETDDNPKDDLDEIMEFDVDTESTGDIDQSFEVETTAAGSNAEVPHFSEPSGEPFINEKLAPSQNIFQPEGQTDLANSRRFVAMHGNRVRFCHPWKKWLVWDGMRWRLDDDGAPMRLVKSVADRIWKFAQEVDSRELRKFATQTAGRSCLSAMLALAQSEVPILPGDLDSNPFLLNCLNGTVDLRTGELRPHRREDNLTKLCPVDFNPDAQSYHWDRFQQDVSNGDTDLIDFKRRLYGYCASGDVREQILPIFWGSGANGKSTELTAIQETLGADYAGAAPKDLLMKRKGNSHPTEIANLFGMRLIVSQESEQDNSLNESLVKQLTGGDRLKARRCKEDFWEFQPSHKLILCTNHKPRVRGTDHAMWRRIRLVPFAVKFDGARIDKSMPEKLKAERQGILAWVVRGAVEWLSLGLGEPESVRTATAAYQTSQDVVAAFLADCCTLGESLWTTTADLRTALEEWQQERGDHKTIDATTLSDGLERHNCTDKRKRQNGKQARGWQGIGLLNDQV